MDEKINVITIKKGSMVTTINRKDLVQVEQSPDGVVFTFKNGFHMIYADQNMPITSKNLIKSTCDNYVNTNINIDLDNYVRPVSVISI